jgi:serine O-acetyltransferase
LGGTTWSAGKRHPTIGHGVVIGAGAKILGPITIGQRARVAANSVVIDNVPEAATVVGIPGRVVVRKASVKGGDVSGMPIDLGHHLIPDPVGKAIACLLDRIGELETELKLIKGFASGGAVAPDACHTCDDTCAQPTFSNRTGA